MSGDATSSKKTGRRRLYLMRHGHVDYFDPDITEHRLVNLTEEGRAQAAAAGNALRSVSIDIAAHSTLPRTMETLEIVLKSRTDGEIAVTPLPGLEELTGGIVEAKSREEL
ncbi:MAG: histidine phosphatase family protein, partial [Pseudomonadota bacterium]